jgi:uncharacterized protein YjdB
MRVRTISSWALTLAITAVVACELPTRPPVSTDALAQLAVSPKVLTLQQYQAADFTAVGFTPAGDTANVAISWTTTSGSITDTSSNSGKHVGRYRAGSDTGKVKVVAKGKPGEPSDTAVVTVTPATVATVAVSPAAASLAVGQTVQLVATPQDADGNPLSGRVVTWASTNPGVATVNGAGLVTAVAAGAATVTVACEGQSNAVAITVTMVPVASVAVSPPSANLTVGQTTQLTATPKDANGNPLSGRTVTWSTSNAAVAAVSGTGLVTGAVAGTATITASSEGRNGTAAITVTLVPVASVSVSPAVATVLVTQTVQLTATPKDINGSTLAGRAVSWASSAPAVATVSGSGLVTAVAAGAATITATSEGKSGTATVSTTVVPVATVAVNPASTSRFVGQTAQLAVATKDSAGNVLTGRTVTWASSSTTVATVSAGGLVTARAAGSATITATSEGKSGTAAVSVTVVPVASVSVSPASSTMSVGGTTQLTATPKDSAGNALTGRVVTWASSAPAVATVSGSGLVTAVAAGAATITATSEGRSGTAAVTVTATVTNPGTVTNLTVAGVTTNSVTLSFTEVTNGAGQPASYAVRWDAGALSWPSATDVAQGTCTVPMAGTTIGAARSCTVLGLSAGTSYQFQLVAFRGTLDIDAVFGAFSNVASGTTSASTAPVASVTVSPATAGVLVGGTQQFTGTLRDASGNVLTGRTITWSSSSLSIATISVGGLASGLVAGTATITATSEGRSGTATLTVSVTPPPPPPGSWPNEPAGFTLVTDEPFNALVENGWHQVQRQTTNGSGLFITTDLTAPLSASSVLDFKFAAGYTGGSEPGVEYYNPSSPVKETYFAFWWKPSNPWQNHSGSGVNKLAFLFPSAGTCIYIMMFSEGGSYTMQVEPEFSGDVRRLAPNRTATPVALGQWHRVEWYVKYSSNGSSRDGVTRWWLDGVLQGEYSDLQMPGDAGFSEYQLAPTWGGINGTKTETDHYWYDHARISKR